MAYDIGNFLADLGAVAELSLAYYRSLKKSGATDKEAADLTRVFMSTFLNPDERETGRDKE